MNVFLKGDLKLFYFRVSNVGLALLNVLLVLQCINDNAGRTNPAVLVTAALQVLFAMDALFFEEYFLQSHDYANTGLGFSYVSTYVTWPFVPTLVTKYIINHRWERKEAELKSCVFNLFY